MFKHIVRRTSSCPVAVIPGLPGDPPTRECAASRAKHNPARDAWFNVDFLASQAYCWFVIGGADVGRLVDD